ncbi:MAG TPA: hypothetical protein VL156_06830 [Terriglobales bacterium]|jgi:hypothetical protein|nr:hypothetical protein [Terriglobales bacterium]
MPANRFRWLEPWLLLEIFVFFNLGFLALDIYLAHSTNSFRNLAEYIPFYFSICAPFALLIGLLFSEPRQTLWKILGHAVGWLAILVGLAGVLFHLNSSFFDERTLKSLTYSAPFAAPLAYTGLGFLLVLNRMVDANSLEWSRWVLFMTLGGYAGNFIFSVMDHASNGFFNPVEWVPVVASALAIGFLLTPLLAKVSREFLGLCVVLLLLEAVVGIWGFVLHAMANLRGPSVHAFDNFVYGAPPFAPLLFPNLVALGLLALWRMWQFVPTSRVAE